MAPTNHVEGVLLELNKAATAAVEHRQLLVDGHPSREVRCEWIQEVAGFAKMDERFAVDPEIRSGKPYVRSKRKTAMRSSASSMDGNPATMSG